MSFLGVQHYIHIHVSRKDYQCVDVFDSYRCNRWICLWHQWRNQLLSDWNSRGSAVVCVCFSELNLHCAHAAGSGQRQVHAAVLQQPQRQHPLRAAYIPVRVPGKR